MTTELQAAAAEIEHKNEPTVPQSDVETDIGTIECFARCHGGEFERDLLASTNRIRAHIAALESDNNRLRESLKGALGYLRNARIDLETGAPKLTAVNTLGGGIAMVEAALAQTDGNVGE